MRPLCLRGCGLWVARISRARSPCACIAVGPVTRPWAATGYRDDRYRESPRRHSFSISTIGRSMQPTGAIALHAQVFSTPIVSTIVNASAWRYSPPLPFSEGGHINADLPLDLAPKSIDVLYILLASRAILQNISTSVGFALLRSAFGPHCTPSDLVPSCVLDYILLTIHLLYRYISGQAITYRCVLCSSDTSRSYSDVLCL